MTDNQEKPSNYKCSSDYIYYHDLPLPSAAHSKKSLEFAQNFSLEDTDVFAVTYPKSVQAVFPPQAVVGHSMSSSRELYLLHRDLLFPKETHCARSLEFSQGFNFKDDDVIAVTYPKSGTIWMQEILPLLLNGGDLTPIHTIPNWDRVPWLEEKRLEVVVDQLTSPRAFVTHFPYNLMPPSFHTSKAKAIYVMRDPRDILVSSYYFHQMAQFLEEPGTFDEFIGKFLEGKVLFGKWTDHVKSWMHTELGDRIMHITYEDMVQDLPAALRRMSDFLGCNLDDETIQKIVEHCSFRTMKENKMSNFSLVPKVFMDNDKSPFLRKGQSGDWKKHFSSVQLARFRSGIHKELEAESCSLPWSLDTMEGTDIGHEDLESP